MGWLGNKPFSKAEDTGSKIATILLGIQFLIGLGLYVISPLVQLGNMGAAMKDPLLRFWTVEHITMMFIAIMVISIGRGQARRATDDLVKHKKITIFFGIGLLLIFFAIPWPFLKSFGTWF